MPNLRPFDSICQNKTDNRSSESLVNILPSEIKLYTGNVWKINTTCTSVALVHVSLRTGKGRQEKWADSRWAPTCFQDIPQNLLTFYWTVGWLCVSSWMSTFVCEREEMWIDFFGTSFAVLSQNFIKIMQLVPKVCLMLLYVKRLVQRMRVRTTICFS